MTHGADKHRTKTDRVISFPRDRRDKPVKDQHLGPGSYGPDVSESMFLDPSLKAGATDRALRRTLSRRLKRP